MTWFNLLKIEDPGSVGGISDWHENARELIERVKESGVEIKISPGDEPNSNKLIVTGRASTQFTLFHPPLREKEILYSSPAVGRRFGVAEVDDKIINQNLNLPALYHGNESYSNIDESKLKLYLIGDRPSGYVIYSAKIVAQFIINKVGGPMHERAREMLDGVINDVSYAKRVGNKIIIKPDWLKTASEGLYYEIDLSEKNFCVYVYYEIDGYYNQLCLRPSDTTMPLDDYYAATILAAGNRETWGAMWPEEAN